MEMKILQFNIQSLKRLGNKVLLELCLNNNQIDAAILSETWLNSNIETSMNGYNFAFSNRPDGFGGVGIYLRKNIKFSTFKINSEVENVGITTLNLNRNINIISLYSTPNTNNIQFKNGLDKIFTHIRQLRGPTLIVGDLNAKGASWDNHTTNRKGYILENLANDYNFRCINDGSPTYAVNSSNASAIDVTFINDNVRCTWKVINKLTNSNHNPIVVTVHSKFKAKTSTSKIITSKVLKDMNEVKVGHNLEEFIKTCNSTIQKNTIKINNSNKYIPKHWWTDTSQRLFRLRNAARKKYNQYKTMQNLELLDIAEKNLREHIKEQKNKNFSEVIDQISNPSCAKEMWAKIRNLKKYQCEKNVNNSWNTQDSIKYLNHITRQRSNNPNNDNSDANSNSNNEGIVEMNIENFSKFLNSRNLNSAKGNDPISYKMLVQLKDEE
ncbi:PREDICTED: putative actin-fragmin kinase DDB_G0287957 [Rhagoletis zephyria]|uniref:putative actin-fragmin kinase DDB_G0287957 n=1 Tax=Rhagoletis zephyria TaxID=28612 RepID=UPI000811637E|nr:PREDICTED: putative actin-fragmin kinase DDB_G0287957 [Rhagoletis zephyria]XP_017493553.1 PREDICTED: putative actin-fragmin kinase DDB_G0287957 [Rhagoletis zephyria]